MTAGPGRDFAKPPPPAHPPAEPGIERRLAAGDALARAVRRRWVALALLLAAGLAGREIGTVPASALSILAVVLGAGLLNGGFHLVVGRGIHPWLLYPSAFLDIVLAVVAVMAFGTGGTVVLFLLAVLPHALDLGRWGSIALVVSAALGYVLAAALEAAWFSGPGIGPRIAAEAVLFTAAAILLLRIPAALLGRVRRARAVMSEAEQGFLAVRAPAVDTDEVGFLERSLNHMLDEFGATFSTVQREADEVAAFAEELAAAAEQLHASSESITSSARVLATDLGAQRGVVDASRLESAKAADQASALRTRAELMQADAERLTTAAGRGRERVERASRTLRDIGDEVRATTASVSGLAGMSERIGTFAQTIARIARQTHLLALNAAIEAARAEEHGEGFAVVADEVRALAAESARSAREVAELVADLRSGIDAAVRAMHAGETKVRDVGDVAGEAEQALQELQQGVQTIGDLVNATAEVSRSQAQRLAELAASLERVAGISAASAGRAEAAAGATTAQITAMTDLTATSQQLAELAERLRGGIARFSVLRRDQATAEHRAVRPAAD